MRPRTSISRRSLVLLLLALTTAILSRELPLRAQAANSDSADANAFASIAEREVSQLRAGFTLSQWMELHGENEGWKRKPDEKLELADQIRRECLSYVRSDTLPSGAKLIVALYFYPPPAPTPAAFPTLTDQELIKTCVLAVVRVEAHVSVVDFGPAREREARGAEFGQAFEQAVQQRFTALYGKSIGAKDVAFWGPGGYRSGRFQNVARWIPKAEIVTGYGPEGFHMPDEEPLTLSPFVFVRARLPLVREYELRIGRTHLDPALQAAQFRRADAAAAVGAALSNRMEELYQLDTALAKRLEEQAEEICRTRCVPEAMPKPTGSNWKEPLLPLLQDWFKALKPADPGRRAAGLLAADRLLTAFGTIRPWNHFGDVKSSTAEQSKLRSALQKLGATFEPGYAVAWYSYSGNWLDQARNLAPDTEAGRLALVMWMSNGNVCPQAGPEAFRKVITEGETLLTTKIDAPTAAQVHFMVGDAYSDIVAISAGEAGGNGEYDPSQYQSEAGADRVKALEHYRAGLAVDMTSSAAKEAWRQAWHLAAGLLPDERYVCFGD